MQGIKRQIKKKKKKEKKKRTPRIDDELRDSN